MGNQVTLRGGRGGNREREYEKRRSGVTGGKGSGGVVRN